jgi:2-oxoglutarate ferredoxin oxidoreductase subunit gamma
MGGQGVGYAAHLMGEALTRQGLNVAVHHSYGAEVRGGKVYSDIIYSDEPILSPFVEKLDIVLILHSIAIESVHDLIRRDSHVIVDEDLCRNVDLAIRVTRKPFLMLSHKNQVPLNMVAIGFLAKICGLNRGSFINVIRDYKKNVEPNVRAFELGYEL